MKILFLHSLAAPELGGGAEVMVWEQMRGLRNIGHECVLLTTSPRPGLQRDQREGITIWAAGIRNIYWPFHKERPVTLLRMLWHLLDSYNPWMQGYIQKVVAEEQPDVASLHNLAGWSTASWTMLARMGIPAVQVLHDHYLICPKAVMHKSGRNCTKQCAECRMLRLPHRTLSRQVQGVVGVSRFILERHQALGFFENAPIQRTIYNARAPQALGIAQQPGPTPHATLRFGYMGRLEPSKGIDYLVDAFKFADLPSAELWIAGSGTPHYENRLRNKASDERIKLLGRVNPQDFCPQVDVIAVPSLCNDSLPGVVFEALAFGKPVIGSRRGGIPEMIRDGVNGLLFEPDVPTELPNALCRIQNDGTLLARLAANASVSSGPFLDIAMWIKTYEALYRKVAKLDAMVQVDADEKIQ